jgi:thioredoxin reductase (NADPH)
MAGQFLQSVDELSDRIRTVTNVVAFDARSITASTEGGETFTGRAAVIATGVSRRKLNVPGESELTGRGILLSGAGQKSETAGKRVAIIGGGDAALENALILSRFATRVFVVHRRDRFSARDGFVSRAARSKNVEFLFNSTVMSINGEDRVHSLTLRSVVDATTHELDVDLVLIRIGVKPNTEIFADQIELDGRGYIIVDALAVTNVKNIFAAGDVANPISPTISTAVGMASTAVKAIDSFIWRETRS